MSRVRIIKDEPLLPTRASLKAGMVLDLVEDNETPVGKVAVNVFLGDVGYEDCRRKDLDDWKVFYVDAALTVKC